MLTIDILICTINEGILNVPKILLPVTDSIGYVVSMQYTDEKYIAMIPKELDRKDVYITKIKGRGLSVNRNNSILNSDADICIIADDDVRYDIGTILRLRQFYDENPDVGVVLMRAADVDGNFLKEYPKEELLLKKMPKGYYPSSIEISFRRKSLRGIMFDGRFGLGSEITVCGEEEVFVHSLMKNGVLVKFVPVTLVYTTERPKSALGFAERKELQFTKGAVLYYIYGWSSFLRCLKCALKYAIEERKSFFSMYKEMLKGILYIKRTEKA